MRAVRRQLTRCLATIAVFAGASPALARDGLADHGDEGVWIEVAAFLPNVDSSIQVSSPGSGVPGTVVDLEKDLRLKDRKLLPAISMGVRLSRSWTLIGEVYQLNRRNSAAIDHDITFEDVVYPVTTTVESQFDSRIYRLAVNYSLIRNASTEAGVSFGAHVTQFKTALSAEIVSSSGTGQVTRRSKEVLAPLPTIGAYVSHRILPRVTLSARADAFSLKFNGYSGRIVNLQASVAYALTRRLSIGAMYRHIAYRLNADKPDWSGRARYKFQGPAVVLKFGF